MVDVFLQVVVGVILQVVVDVLLLVVADVLLQAVVDVLCTGVNIMYRWYCKTYLELLPVDSVASKCNMNIVHKSLNIFSY